MSKKLFELSKIFKKYIFGKIFSEKNENPKNVFRKNQKSKIFFFENLKNDIFSKKYFFKTRFFSQLVMFLLTVWRGRFPFVMFLLKLLMEEHSDNDEGEGRPIWNQHYLLSRWIPVPFSLVKYQQQHRHYLVIS